MKKKIEILTPLIPEGPVGRMLICLVCIRSCNRNDDAEIEKMKAVKREDIKRVMRVLMNK